MVIGIVEDDLFFQEELVSFLHTLSDIEDISVFAKGEDFLNSADNLNLDVLFLDIGLPGASGVEVAKCIRRDSPLLDIVFITADDSYIKDAFQLYASDYIEKPLNSERLKTTLERIRSRLVGFNQRIELKTEEGVIFLNHSEIYWVEALAKKSMIHTKSHSFTCLYTLKEMEKKLDQRTFFRAGRSDLVNLRFVESIQPSSRNLFEIIFKGKDERAFLQKDRYQEFRKRIKSVG